MLASENRMRCDGRQSAGTGCSSGRLRASALTFLAPGTMRDIQGDAEDRSKQCNVL